MRAKFCDTGRGMLPLYDTIPSRNPPVAMWLLIGAHVLVFMFAIGLTPLGQALLFQDYGLVPARITLSPAYGLTPPYWTFVTCTFLHAGWLHILANLWTLWIFGDNVEDRMGPARFVAFYLACGVVAGLAELWIRPTSTVPMVGASGAIAGVMGAYLAMYPRARIVLMLPILFWPLFFELPALLFLVYWFFVQVLSGGLGPGATLAEGGVAYWAHIGGFVAGLALHRLFLSPAARAPCRDEDCMEYAWRPPR